jgi:signal peptidase I
VIPLLAQAEGVPSRYQQIFDQLARTPLSHVLIFVAICTALRMATYPVLTKTEPHRRAGSSYPTIKFLNEVLDAIIYAGVVVFMLIRPFGVQTFLIPSGSMLETLQINDFIIANKAIYRSSEPKRGDIIVFKPPVEALDADQKDVDFIKRLMGKPGDLVEVKDGQVVRNGVRLSEPYLSPANQYVNNDWKLVYYDGPYQPWKGHYIPVYYQRSGSGSSANWQTPSSGAYSIGFDRNYPDVQKHSIPLNGSWLTLDKISADDMARMQYLVDAPPAKIPDGYFLMMGDNRNESYDGRGWGLVPRENIVGRSEIIWWPAKRWRRTLPVRVGKETQG